MKTALLAALAVALAATGCRAGTTATSREVGVGTLDRIRPVATAPVPALPVTVTGADGARVTVADTSRIIPLTGGVAEIVYSLGLGPAVVARDVTTTIDDARALPVVTTGHSISAEGVLALRPTLVVGDERTGPKAAIAQLRGAGIPVVIVRRALGLADVAPRIAAVAEAVGLEADGAALIRRTHDEITAIRSAAGAKRVRVAFLYVRGTAGVYLLGGKGSGADGLLAALGATDVGANAGLGDFTPLTAEALVRAQPDVLLVMTDGLKSVGGVDGLVQLNGVAQTPAGKNRRVVAIDDGLLLNFGPRTPAALKRLADGLAPYRS